MNVKLEINASTGRCSLNDPVSEVSSISKMSYTIESFTKKIIHNANEYIVVGVNNDQLITGKKIFAIDSIANQSGKIYIGTKSDNTGAFELSSKNDSFGTTASLVTNGSIKFYPKSDSEVIGEQVHYSGNIGDFSPVNGYSTNDLGRDFLRWSTLYCNKLSDGTTTKTMTEVLTGYTTEQKVQEMIDASIGTAIGGTY